MVLTFIIWSTSWSWLQQLPAPGRLNAALVWMFSFDNIPNTRTRLLATTQQLQFTQGPLNDMIFLQLFSSSRFGHGWSIYMFVICWIFMDFLRFCCVLEHVQFIFWIFLDCLAQVARHPIPHGQPCGYRAQGLAGPGPGGRAAGGAGRDAPGAAAAYSAAGDAKSKGKDRWGG